MPQAQPPRIRGQRTKAGTGALPVYTDKLTTAHADDVIQRPARHHAVERQDQQRSDHPHDGRPGPARRGPRLQCQGAQGIHRAAASAPAQHRLGQHDRQPDQRDTDQIHQHKGAATIDAGHIGKLPYIAQAHCRSRGREDEYPATGPDTVDGDIVLRHGLTPAG